MSLFGPPDVAKLTSKGDMPGLIKALEYEKDHGIRRDAAASLGNANEARAVEPLIASLRDSEPAVCRAAATALGLIGDPRAVEPLIRIAASQDADQDVRNDAVKALVTLGPGAVKPLVDSLRSRSPNIRQVATETLGQVGSPAVEVLVAALGEQDADMRAAATEALGKLGWQPDKTVAGAIYWADRREWAKCVEIGAPAVEALLAVLRDSNMDVRGAAAGTLIQIGAPSVRPLVTALGDDHVRGYAISALVQIGAPSVQALIAALGDGDEDVNKAAAIALGQIGDARAVEPLIAALEDGPSSLNKAAITALGQIGDARAVEPLSEWLNEGFGGEEEKQAAAEAMGEIGDASAREPLLWRFEHSDGRLSEFALAALVKLGWKPDKSSAGAKYWVDKGKWTKCVEIGAAAVEPLCAVLKDGPDGVNLPAAEALGQIGDPRALEPLLAAVRKITLEIERQKPDFWGYMQRNLMPGTDPKEVELQAVKSRLTHAAAEIVTAQSRPTPSATDSADLDELVRRLGDSAQKVRIEAAQELGRLRDRRALKPLVSVYEADSDTAVREFARDAIWEIDPKWLPSIRGVEIVQECVAELVRFYDQKALSGIKEVGGRLHQAGGFKLMVLAHGLFRRQRGPEAGSYLEGAWDGVGDWLG